MAGEQVEDGVDAMTPLARLLRRLVLVGVSLIVLVGCVAEGVGYYGPGPGYDLDYYGGYGFDYGVWGPTYDVAPFYRADRYGRYRGAFTFGGRPTAHGLRGVGAVRRIPTIPSARRGGGPAPRGGGGGGRHR